MDLIANPFTFPGAVIWLGALATLALYSVLYRENPVYRFAEHVFLGLALAGANARSSGEGEDGLLTAREATGMNLWGTRLVVLSACDTGVGEGNLNRAGQAVSISAHIQDASGFGGATRAEEFTQNRSLACPRVFDRFEHHCGGAFAEHRTGEDVSSGSAPIARHLPGDTSITAVVRRSPGQIQGSLKVSRGIGSRAA